MSFSAKTCWRLALPATAGAIMNSSAVAQDVLWPHVTKSSFGIVAMVPGCDGFDGSGNDMEVFDGTQNFGGYVRNEGETDTRPLVARVAKYKKELSASYDRSEAEFHRSGMAVVKIDYGPRPNCRDAGSDLAGSMEKVKRKITATLSAVRQIAKINKDQVYVVANSLGAGGVLKMFKDWGASEMEAGRPNRAVLYFPTCETAVDGWQAMVPTLILVGKLDDVPLGYKQGAWIKLADACRKQREQQGAGSKLVYHEYDKAFHGFNLPGSDIPIKAELRIPTIPRYRFTAYAYDGDAAAKAASAQESFLK